MKHMLGLNMSVVCNAAGVLESVRANRGNHAKIVAEARIGFVTKAKEVLEKKLVELKEGRLKSLEVRLDPPSDYTKEYDTVIRMLEMHTEPTITLDADAVRMFVQDQWDWTERFLLQNSAYSGTARERYLGG